MKIFFWNKQKGIILKPTESSYSKKVCQKEPQKVYSQHNTHDQKQRKIRDINQCSDKQKSSATIYESLHQYY
jgi:hypothetical protein